MKFCSFFSGIEAASVASKELGWEALSFSEIEPFPCAVLAHHYPAVPNHGDILAYDWAQYHGKADIVVGGPPCQAFSVAGLRRSLQDERGNLSLGFARAINAISPRWLMLENVPGMLNTADNAFGCVLAGLAGYDAALLPGTKDGRWSNAGIVPPAHKDGYGLAWRVLDAQHFGVPQRRRRVFVVGYFGAWQPAAEVLFERENSDKILCEEQPGSDTLPSFKTEGGGVSLERLSHLVYDGIGIRKYTPEERERLFGFPDGYTRIPYRGKPADQCPDGPRYKALGNSWAVPCARWIFERIDAINKRII